jgi:hypothetical protein
VLAFGLAFLFSASRMPTRERGAGKFSVQLTAGDFRRSWENLILQSDTVWCFSGKFVMIQDDVKRRKGLIFRVEMTCEDSGKPSGSFSRRAR